jgi:hypothetical protein
MVRAYQISTCLAKKRIVKGGVRGRRGLVSGHLGGSVQGQHDRPVSRGSQSLERVWCVESASGCGEEESQQGGCTAVWPRRVRPDRSWETHGAPATGGNGRQGPFLRSISHPLVRISGSAPRFAGSALPRCPGESNRPRVMRGFVFRSAGMVDRNVGEFRGCPPSYNSPFEIAAARGSSPSLSAGSERQSLRVVAAVFLDDYPQRPQADPRLRTCSLRAIAMSPFLAHAGALRTTQCAHDESRRSACACMGEQAEVTDAFLLLCRRPSGRQLRVDGIASTRSAASYPPAVSAAPPKSVPRVIPASMMQTISAVPSDPAGG